MQAAPHRLLDPGEHLKLVIDLGHFDIQPEELAQFDISINMDAGRLGAAKVNRDTVRLLEVDRFPNPLT